MSDEKKIMSPDENETKKPLQLDETVPEKKPESNTSTMMTATRIPMVLELPAVNNRLRSIVVVEYPP